MSERTILKLEIIEHDNEWSGPKAEYVMTYAEPDLKLMAQYLMALALTLSETAAQGGWITRRDG